MQHLSVELHCKTETYSSLHIVRLSCIYQVVSLLCFDLYVANIFATK